MWRIASVGLSVFGVFVIAYGDSAGAGPRTTSNTTSWNSRMIGNGLAIFGSVAYAWYVALLDTGPMRPLKLKHILCFATQVRDLLQAQYITPICIVESHCIFLSG